jgi:hypothetical protein
MLQERLERPRQGPSPTKEEFESHCRGVGHHGFGTAKRELLNTYKRQGEGEGQNNKGQDDEEGQDDEGQDGQEELVFKISI